MLSGTGFCHAARKPASAAEEGWSEISPRERALTRIVQDPDADAVILNSERHGKIIRQTNFWVNVLDYHWRLKVLNERGKRYGEVHIRAHKNSRVSNIRGRTVHSDGTIVPLAPDQIFEKVLFQAGDFKVTEWVFKFAAVEPGAILEYRYDRHDDFIFYIDPWYFSGPEFTVRSQVTQAVPTGSGYFVLCDRCPSVKPTITEWGEGRVRGQLYSLELQDLPGYRNELMMPPQRDVMPRLEMVLQSWKDWFWEAVGRRHDLFTDWTSVTKYVNYHYQAVIKPRRPELKKGLEALHGMVDQWVEGLTDPAEKIKAVFRHVQRDFRYIRYDSVIGSVRSIGAILKSRTADNEEKAVLMMAALRAIGVESHAALVSGRDSGALNPKFFTPSQFSHAVVALPRSGGTYWWLDPTVRFAPFGFLPWKDSGATALLVSKDKAEIANLPVENQLSATKYRVTVKPRRDGKADLEVEAEYQGEDAIDMREDLAPASESTQVSYLEGWVARRREGAALRRHAIENLDDVEKPLLITMSIEAPRLVTMADDVMLVRACILSCYDTNPISRGARERPFYVDRGWNDEETLVMHPPAGMAAAQMPLPVVAKSAIGVMSLSCMSQAEGSVRCSRQFVARRNRWPATEHGNIRAMFDKIIEADRTTVAFEAAEPAAAR